jgi:tetrahydromethanopterin S-methyltransferase subunit D
MSAKRARSRGWPVRAVNAPKLSNLEWGLAAVPAVILLVAAILQLISFADFRDGLATMGLSAPTAWAVGVIIAELWGAAGFLMWPLSLGFRYVSHVAAVLAAGFWFVNNLQLVSGNLANQVHNSDFFGRFLKQSPGWWTVIEVSILLFWIVYKVGLLRNAQTATRTR